MAEREGFEPSVEFPLHTLSKRAQSTTLTSLRVESITCSHEQAGIRAIVISPPMCRDHFRAFLVYPCRCCSSMKRPTLVNPEELNGWNLQRNRPVQRFAKRKSASHTFVDFPRKSFRLFTFFNQATWLVLALETLFWRVTGTIVGTVPHETSVAADALVTMCKLTAGAMS